MAAPDAAGEPAGETARPASPESDADLFVSRQATGRQPAGADGAGDEGFRATSEGPRLCGRLSDPKTLEAARPFDPPARRRGPKPCIAPPSRPAPKCSPIRRPDDAGPGAAGASRKSVRMSQRSACKDTSRATGRTGDRTWCARRPPKSPMKSSVSLRFLAPLRSENRRSS